MTPMPLLPSIRSDTPPRTLVVALPALHADQAQVYATLRAQRVAVLVAGRRWGKTHLLVRVAVERALKHAAHVGYFAPTYKHLLPAWEQMTAVLTPPLATIHRTERKIDLLTGGRIECWSLDTSDTVARGRGYDLVIVDEASIVPHLRSVWEQNLLPTLAGRSGQAILAGTPKGLNDFAALAQTARHRSDWQCIRRRTADNPLLAPSDLALLRATMSERAAAQEFDAVFLTDGGAVLRNIAACVVDDDKIEQSDEPAIIGVDWGRYHDATAIIALDPVTRHVIAHERLTDMPFERQLAVLKHMWQQTGCGPVIAEANALGLPLVERLANAGLPIQALTMTAARKVQLIDALAVAIEQAMLAIPRAATWLIDELMLLTMSRSSSGVVRYHAPEGAHDDGVIALALAWSGINDAPTVLFEV